MDNFYKNYRIGKLENGKQGYISIDFSDCEIGDYVDILLDCPDNSGRKYSERGLLVEIIEQVN